VTENRSSWGRRAALGAVVSAAIIGVAVVHGYAIVGGRGPSYRIESEKAVLEPVEGSEFVRAYPVTMNGSKGRFAHYTAGLTAEEVVARFRERMRRAEGAAAPVAGPPLLSAAGAGRAVLSYVARDGSTVGVVAFDAAEGCAYFVGRTPAPHGRSSGRLRGDRPGREPPGVPKPSLSTRELCIENLGGVPSVLAFYAAWGSPAELVADMRGGMVENGWTVREGSSRLLTENYDGLALLSFVRGREQCLVAVDRERKTGKMVVVVFWARRAWLPEGTAL